MDYSVWDVVKKDINHSIYNTKTLVVANIKEMFKDFPGSSEKQMHYIPEPS